MEFREISVVIRSEMVEHLDKRGKILNSSIGMIPTMRDGIQESIKTYSQSYRQNLLQNQLIMYLPLPQEF